MRTIEIFVSGCPRCDEAVKLVEQLTCPSCAVEIRDLKDEAVANRARDLGVQRTPAVAVDGRLADCCTIENGTISEAALRAAGVGQPLA